MLRLKYTKTIYIVFVIPHDTILHCTILHHIPPGKAKQVMGVRTEDSDESEEEDESDEEVRREGEGRVGRGGGGGERV